VLHPVGLPPATLFLLTASKLSPVSIMSSGKILIALLVIGLAGCASQAPSVKLRIAGGEKITVDLGRGGVVGGENKDVKIEAAGIVPNATSKQVVFFFGVVFKTGGVPKSVKVEDVTEDAAVPMIEDSHPKLAGKAWRWSSPPVSPDNISLRWIHEIDESFRVYRFTIVLSDDRQIVVHHAVFYPAFVKMRMRHDLGLETP
jgi:hypothetical protein